MNLLKFQLSSVLQEVCHLFNIKMALPTPKAKKASISLPVLKQMVIFGLLMVMVMFCSNHKVNHSEENITVEVDEAFQICKTIITYFALICGLAVLIAILVHFLKDPITDQQRYYRTRRNSRLMNQRSPSPDVLMARKSAAALNYRNCQELRCYSA